MLQRNVILQTQHNFNEWRMKTAAYKTYRWEKPFQPSFTFTRLKDKILSLIASHFFLQIFTCVLGELCLSAQIPQQKLHLSPPTKPPHLLHVYDKCVTSCQADWVWTTDPFLELPLCLLSNLLFLGNMLHNCDILTLLHLNTPCRVSKPVSLTFPIWLHLSRQKIF